MHRLTIEQILENWLHDVHAVNTKKTTQDTVRSAIERHVYPFFGAYDARTIKPDFLLKKLNAIEHYSIRKRILQDLVNAYNYAIVCGHMTSNPASSLKKFIKKSDNKKGSHAVLPKKRWSAFFRDVEITKHTEVTKLYFWAVAYSALRASEAAGALKSEFNFEDGTWIVPAHRMKNKKVHTVYLADTLLNMLQAYFEKTDSKYAFHSPHTSEDKPINPWSGLYIIKKAGYECKQTQHGLRKIFSSHAHESGLFSIDAIELSIDHRIKGVRGVYNLAGYDDERRQLMTWYASELNKWRGIK